MGLFLTIRKGDHAADSEPVMATCDERLITKMLDVFYDYITRGALASNGRTNISPIRGVAASSNPSKPEEK